MSRRIPSAAPAVRHGIGLFETMLVARGRVHLVDAHFARLASTAERLGFAAPDRRAFDDAVSHELETSEPRGETVLRVQWLAIADALDDRGSWRLETATAAVPAVTLSRRRRGRAITLPAETRRALPYAKTTSWVVETLALRNAIQSGADEAFFVDARGRILEGTSTNVFAIDGDRLLTAPDDAVLPGIVRAWVISNAARVGWRVTMRAPSREQVLRGAFMTSSLTKLAPVRMLDGLACPRIDDERLESLRRLFSESVLAKARRMPRAQQAGPASPRVRRPAGRSGSR